MDTKNRDKRRVNIGLITYARWPKMNANVAQCLLDVSAGCYASSSYLLKKVRYYLSGVFAVCSRCHQVAKNVLLQI